MTQRPLILLLLPFLLLACSLTATPDPDLAVQQALAQTMAALPAATLVPIPTAYPTPTPLDLNGLFCEYQFCIGHPPGMAFYDHLAALNPQTPSQYANGFLVAYKIPALVINVIWLQAPGTADPQFLLDTILDAQADAKTGNLDVKLVRGMNVVYTDLITIISGDVPYGGAAAWTCGDRVFAWKAYVPGPESARPLFEDGLSRFGCNE